MKKQLITLSLALAMLSTTALAAPSPWATTAIEKAVEKGIVTADFQGDYQAPITCQGFCDLAQTLYPDMSMLRLDQWLFRWRTNQTDDLDPSEPLTREQMAVALYGLAKELDIELLYTTPNYTDIGDISEHAQCAVGVLQTANIMNGYTDGCFDPQGECTVEQAMVVLSRLSTATSNVAIYDADGMNVAIPTSIENQLLINPNQLANNTLIKVYETASYTQTQADFGGDDGMGFLFAIKRYTQAEYEEYLYYDMAGHSVFATDDTYYYVKQVATDVQFYRSNMADYTEEALEDWSALLDATNGMVDDFILRNDLTLYDEIVDRDLWGITLTTTDVTPTGMTLLCTQAGGAQQGQLQTGTPYTLEIYQDGGWETVDYLPQEYNIGWTTIAWMIPENQTTEWTVDWDWLYGDLPSGTYRIGKSVTDFIETGIYEEQMYYAVFEIG